MKKVIKIGPLTVRVHIRNGRETEKWQLDIPAKLTPNCQRRRKLFDNQKAAVECARRLKRGLENRSLGFAEPTRRSGVSFKEIVQRWVEHEEGRVRTLKKRKNPLQRIKAVSNRCSTIWSA